jgi:hypothetical protein
MDCETQSKDDSEHSSHTSQNTVKTHSTVYSKYEIKEGGVQTIFQYYGRQRKSLVMKYYIFFLYER